MGMKQIQANFTSGELDPRLRARTEVTHYYNGVDKGRDVFVLPQGGVRRRPGLEYKFTLPFQLTLVTGITPTAPNGGSASEANDADPQTYIETTTNIGVVNPYVIVHFDLGSAKTIQFADTVGLWVTTGSGVDGEVFIQYSTDNAAWTSLGDAIPVNGFTSVLMRNRRRVGPVTARYWRVARIGATNLGTAKFHINEFELWTMGSTLSEARMVYFEYDAADHYLLVFSDRNITIVQDGEIYGYIRSPYTSAQLAALSWAQIDQNRMIFTNIATRVWKLTREAVDEEFTLDVVDFTFNLPRYAFTPTTTLGTNTLTPSSVTGSITLTAGAANFTAGDVGQIVEGNGGRVRITKYTSTTVVSGVCLLDFYDTQAILSGAWTIIRGHEDSWSDTRGWPRSVTFHQNRLYFGGTRSLPATVWGSCINQPFNFSLGQNLDDEAIDYQIGSDDAPTIINLRSSDFLLIFASTSEHYVPQQSDEPITPSTFKTRRTSSRGSKEGLQNVEVAGPSMFVQRGGKSLREYQFNEVRQTYESPNLALLSSHLFVDPVDIGLRRATSTDEADLVLLANDDGTLAVLTTLRDEEVNAWSLCSTPDGSFKNVGVDADDIYFMIERSINSVTVRYVEKFNSDLLVDCGVLYEFGTETAVLTGAAHLNGETVSVLVDDMSVDDELVAAGSVTPEFPAEESAQLGLFWAPLVKTMPVVMQLEDGTQMNRKKRIAELMLQFYETSNAVVDGEEVEFLEFGAALDAPITPFTGRKVIDGRLGWDVEAQVTITQSRPAPFTLLSIEQWLEL